MDYVDWCDRVLQLLAERSRVSSIERTIGVHAHDLAKRLVQQDSRDVLYEAEVVDALTDLSRLGLVDDRSAHYWKITSLGRELAADITPFWQAICQTQLDAEHAQLLQVVNQLSTYGADDHAGTNWVEREALDAALAWEDDDLLYPVAKELQDGGLIGMQAYMGRRLKVHSTYRGLVCETRRAFTVESAFIDALVAEWETTSVDFKRELDTKTADEKAELIKDVLGLVNTQASGRRWLMISFDEKTRSYYGPPNPKLTQNHLEQLLAHYTAPVVTIRYEVVAYRKGPVGKLEVLREPSKLPYTVSRAIGDKKRIVAGQVFVRHGSQTEEPTPAELAALQAEADRARSARDVETE